MAKYGESAMKEPTIVSVLIICDTLIIRVSIRLSYQRNPPKRRITPYFLSKW